MKRFSHYHNNYLSKCDLINKYNKTDVLTFSQLDSIVLDIPLKQLMNLIVNFSNSKNFISKTEIKLFFILYLQYGLRPYINFKKNKENKRGCSLKLKISNFKEMNLFVSDFFVYLNSNTFFKHSMFLNKIDRNSVTNLNELVLNFKIPIFFIPGLNILTDHFFQNINLKEFYVFLNFNFKNIFSELTDINKLIRNLPCFWEIKKFGIKK